MQHAIKGVLAAVMIAGASGAAWAAPAIVETDLNVRSGPSTGYAVLDTMPAGATVDVIACYQGWCEIVWDGLGGFASRAYLEIGSSVTIVEPPVGAIVTPGIVVYEARYYARPIWTSRGHIIRQAIRRDIRRDLRQDRREDRREVRQERRKDRREDRREVRQDRREDRVDRTRDVRRELRRTRQDRADTVRERPRRIEDSRRSVERRPAAASRARVQRERREVRQEQRQQRREVRQERRNDAAQARPQRERRETTGRGGR